MGKYKLIVFDMDGTLADTSTGILNSVRYVQRKMDLPEIPLSKMYSHVGPPMEESYNQNFDLTGERLKQAISLHKRYAIEQGYKELQWYEGITKLLDRLRKNSIATAIATLKAHATILKILDKFNMSDKFDIVIGTFAENPMNKAQLLEYCVKKSGYKKENTVFIGDSCYDALGAQSAGIDFIAVTYGFGFKQAEDVKRYHYLGICNNVNEIEQILEGNI